MAGKKKSSLRSTPTRRQETELDKFAAAADRNTKTESAPLPWEEPHIREDVVKNLPLRISEPLYLKLKYIAAHTPYSMNSFIIECISEEIDREIEQLLD